jgi:hypothetical protein
VTTTDRCRTFVDLVAVLRTRLAEVEADHFLGLHSRAIWTRIVRFIPRQLAESVCSRARQRSRWPLAFQHLDAGNPASGRVSGGNRIAIPALFNIPQPPTGTLQMGGCVAKRTNRRVCPPGDVGGCISRAHTSTPQGVKVTAGGGRAWRESESAVGAIVGSASNPNDSPF